MSLSGYGFSVRIMNRDGCGGRRGGQWRKTAEVKFLVTWCVNAVVYGIMPSITGVVV